MKKFINFTLSTPLRGIGEYKDTLDLSTGIITRRIREYTITGDEGWDNRFKSDVFYIIRCFDSRPFIARALSYSSHFIYNPVQVGVSSTLEDGEFGLQRDSDAYSPSARLARFNTTNEFLNWISEQNSNNTPVKIWYPLQRVSTETIQVPAGLSGIIEGYSIQDITPMIDNPVYPEEKTTIVGWFDCKPQKRENGAWVEASEKKYSGGWQLPQAQALSLSNSPMLSMAIPDIDEPIPVIEPEE